MTVLKDDQRVCVGNCRAAVSGSQEHFTLLKSCKAITCSTRTTIGAIKHRAFVVAKLLGIVFLSKEIYRGNSSQTGADVKVETFCWEWMRVSQSYWPYCYQIWWITTHKRPRQIQGSDKKVPLSEAAQNYIAHTRKKGEKMVRGKAAKASCFSNQGCTDL